MTGQKHYELVNKEEICPECGLHAPKRQVDNLGMCERCSMDGKVKIDTGETLDTENNLIDKWKYRTPTGGEIQSEGAV